ncbi:MAG: type sorting protein [Mucilaginibacter sp.]|nr:type sorting protein [Mucilaginibacter sp.]
MIFKYSFKAFLACIALIISNIFNNALAQAPKITYPSPPASYPINVPITPLMPTNNDGAVPATIYGQVSTFAGGRGLLPMTVTAPTPVSIYLQASPLEQPEMLSNAPDLYSRFTDNTIGANFYRRCSAGYDIWWWSVCQLCHQSNPARRLNI